MVFSQKIISRRLILIVNRQLKRQYERTYSSTNHSLQNGDVLVDKVFEVTTIGINRPQKRNCVDFSVIEKLQEALTAFEDDPSSDVAVLHGIGGNFCSGFDLEILAKIENNPDYLSRFKAGPMSGLTRRILNKPLVAAVSGYAVAGGFELALMCDLRVVEDTAVMGLFSRRFGVPILDGGTVRLQSMLGLSRTLDLVLTGRTIKAKEALEWGIANRIVACGTGLGQAIQLASSIQKFPKSCMIADRSSVYNSAFNARSFEEAVDYEKNSASQRVITEAIKGAQKFLTGVGRHGTTTNVTTDLSKH